MEWIGVFVRFGPDAPIMSRTFALDTINHLLFTPNPEPPYTIASFPFDAAMFAREETARQLYSADDPNLAPFAAHGGKLILWHGWSDPHISPINTIDYFGRVGRTMGESARDKAVRLFLFPSMGHCSGGDGPSKFPLLAAMMSWVETGAAPQVLVAHRANATTEGLPGPGGRPAGTGGEHCATAEDATTSRKSPAAQPAGLCVSRGCCLHGTWRGQRCFQFHTKGARPKARYRGLDRWPWLAEPMSILLPDRIRIRAGLVGGFTGGVVIWLYEAVVWADLQQLMPLEGIPKNATGLVFGKAVQTALGSVAYLLGTGIHFFFALAWGVLFALIWPWFRRRGIEATFVALFYAVLIWVVMHAAIAIVSDNHPNYADLTVVIGGLMSHFFYALPLALIVRGRSADTQTEKSDTP